MTKIAEYAKCEVVQEWNAKHGVNVYRVMSKNNVCLFEGTAVKAMEYADWFSKKS